MNILLTVGLTLATAAVVLVSSQLDTSYPTSPKIGSWVIVPDSDKDADRDCAEAVVKNAIIETNLGACEDGLKTIQIKKQTVMGTNYEFLISNLPKNCDAIGGPELCTGTVNIYKGVATLLPLSVSCQSPTNVMLQN